MEAACDYIHTSLKNNLQNSLLCPLCGRLIFPFLYQWSASSWLKPITCLTHCICVTEWWSGGGKPVLLSKVLWAPAHKMCSCCGVHCCLLCSLFVFFFPLVYYIWRKIAFWVLTFIQPVTSSPATNTQDRMPPPLDFLYSLTKSTVWKQWLGIC